MGNWWQQKRSHKDWLGNVHLKQAGGICLCVCICIPSCVCIRVVKYWLGKIHWKCDVCQAQRRKSIWDLWVVLSRQQVLLMIGKAKKRSPKTFSTNIMQIQVNFFSFFTYFGERYFRKCIQDLWVVLRGRQVLLVIGKACFPSQRQSISKPKSGPVQWTGVLALLVHHWCEEIVRISDQYIQCIYF